MTAAIVDVGKERLDGGAPTLLFGVLLVARHKGHVIGVATSQVAFARVNVARLFAVAAGRLVRQICLQTLQPLLGESFALVRDQGSQQRGVIDVLARTDADLAFPFGVSQLLIGDAVLFDAVPRSINDARAHGETEPMIARIAVLRWDRLL